MPGSEDVVEDAKSVQGGAEEFLFERKLHERHQTEAKYFEGASSLADLAQNTSLPNHEEMDAVRLGPGEILATPEPSVDQVQFAEGQNQAAAVDSVYIQLDPPAEKIDLNQLLETARTQFKSNDYAGCLKTLSTGLQQDPGNYLMSTLQKEAQRNYELHRAEEELTQQVASLKEEALSLFHKGQFDKCLEKFKLLCRLEPDNREFRDFLQATEEHLGKSEEAITEPPASREQPPPAAEKAAAEPPQRRSRKPLAESDLQRETKRPEINPQRSEAEAGDKVKRLTLVGLIAGGLLFGALIGGWLTTHPRQGLMNPEFQAEPEGNSALLNREPNAGPERLKIPLSPAQDLQSSATGLFEQGKLLDASRKCDVILAADSENRFARGLKLEIRNRLARLGGQAIAANKWAEARVAWNDVLKVDPNDAEALRQLKVVRAKMKKQEESAIASKTELQRKIEDLRQQISLAVNSKNYLPPNSGNAFDLIKQLSSLAPGDSLAKEKLDQIYLDLLTQTHRKIQARDLASANTMTQQIQTYFPESPELKSLRETLKSEEVKLAEARSILTQRAESAMLAGHYIAPANDNSVAYCNQVLMVDPQNQKALALKKESLAKASAQAQEWIQKGKFEEASGIYSSLLYLSQNESRFPFTSQDLKREIEKLEFTAYPVIHAHTLGSCSGRLRFNGYLIAYVPSGESRDGFSQAVKEITQIEGGDKLKVQVKDKTYRFEISTAKSKEENREKIKSMVERLTLLTNKKAVE
jgi:tetratricopeptide (TPR) repeat protein